MFKIPIIPPDLRHEETIIQAAHALACLEKTIFSVFDTIDNRIKTNESKLQIINHRIRRAQERLVGSKESGLQGLLGSKKSITIFAPSRFPGTQVLHEKIPSTFTKVSDHSCDKMDHSTKEIEQCRTIRSRLEQPHAHSDKLVFFHVRSAPEWHQRNELSSAKIASGLGLMPEETAHVTSTLRFNTDEFVYDSTSTSAADSWKQAKLFKRERQPLQQAKSAVRGPQLAPAPHSLTHRDHKASRTLCYTPRLRDLPDMDLPTDLPDLPGIADDIQFVAQEQQRIAPSLLIEDLPDLDELEKQQQLNDEKMGASAMETTATPKFTSESFASNLPNPPPPLSVNKVPVATLPPPPPPPPPPQLPTMPETLPSQDMRSDLMAAIRKAGGVERARLRPAAPINAIVNQETDALDNNVRNTEKAASSHSGGGLMAELHNKLLLRRKGISGAKDKDGEENQMSHGSSNPLLTHLSTLIPQTKLKKQTEQHDDDEDEWAD